MIAALLLTALSFLGTVLTTAQALLTAAFRRRRRPFADGLREQAFRPDGSFVSILKPVCGLDDELEENLLSFVSLPGIRYEVILSVEDHGDPALPILKTAARDHPDVFRLVIGGISKRRGVVNRKVQRLIAAARVARGDVFFISDSNVRVEAADIARTVEILRDPGVGCVSNLFTGSSPESLGAILESAHLLAFVVPGCVLATSAGAPCVVGKSMAVTRRALQAIGGFEAFQFVLAEDQAIGLAIRNAGFEVVLSPVVVRNVIVRRTLGRALARQVRWNQIRYSFSRPLYALEILLNPWPLAIVASLLGAPVLLPMLVGILRLAQVEMLRQSTGAHVPLWAIPLLDVMMLCSWFVPFFSNRIIWRGYVARIGRNTQLIEAAA